MNDEALAEIFSFLTPKAKTISALRLVSPSWAVSVGETAELEFAATSDAGEGFAIVNATSAIGKQTPAKVTLKSVSKQSQLDQTKRYIEATTPRLQGHNVALDITLELANEAIFKQALTAFNRHPKLQLGLEPKFAVTDLMLQAITQAPAVTKLDLNQSKAVTNSGLDHAVTVMPNIVSLNLSNNSSITADGMSIVRTKLPTLKHLFIHRCTGIANKGLDYVGELEDLETLELDGCDQFTDEGIALLVFGAANLPTE